MAADKLFDQQGLNMASFRKCTNSRDAEKLTTKESWASEP